jgi:nicotinate-nucleotide pyrophosphorylase (carboxylating)
MATQPSADTLQHLWHRALAEDGADRDITSLVSIPEQTRSVGRLIAKTDGVFAGENLFAFLKRVYSRELALTVHVQDGDRMPRGTVIANIEGPLRLLLGIERTLLNFLQRLCGVATLTLKYVDAVAGTPAKIYDTRKTIPGWRELDKYAVRCGGGVNHRTGLHDAILVKDNHLAGIPIQRLAQHVFEMLNQAVELKPAPAFFEVEVDTLDQFDELLKVVGIDVILLDNFTLDQMREAVRRRQAAGLAGKLALEASGGVDLSTVADIARTGVDRISVGALTHSARALDISLDIQPAA